MLCIEVFQNICSVLSLYWCLQICVTKYQRRGLFSHYRTNIGGRVAVSTRAIFKQVALVILHPCKLRHVIVVKVLVRAEFMWQKSQRCNTNIWIATREYEGYFFYQNNWGILVFTQKWGLVIFKQEEYQQYWVFLILQRVVMWLHHTKQFTILYDFILHEQTAPATIVITSREITSSISTSWVRAKVKGVLLS